MRFFATLQAVCAFDNELLQKAFDQKVTLDDTDAATASIPQSGIVTLAAAETSTPFDYGSVSSAAVLMIIAYDEIQVQLGSNTAPLITVRPVPANAPASVVSQFQREDQPGILFLRGKVDSFFLTNPSATAEARAFVAIVGDAV